MAAVACEHCGEANPAFLCTRCRAARFCGRACFRRAWQVHKYQCAPTSNVSPAAASSRLTSESSTKAAPSDIRSVQAPARIPTASSTAPAQISKSKGVDYSKFANIEDSDDEAIVPAQQTMSLPIGQPRENVTREEYDKVFIRLLQDRNLPFMPPPDMEQMWGYYKYGGLDEQALLDQACEAVGNLPLRLEASEWKAKSYSLTRKLDKENREDEARMWCAIHMVRFPQDADSYYNSGVLLNKMRDKAKFGGSPSVRLPSLSGPSKMVPLEQYCSLFSRAAAANYRRCLKVDPKSRAGYINLIGCLERHEPKNWYDDVHELAIAAVKNGIWYNKWQRPPHFVSSLLAKPFHEPQGFQMCRALEENYHIIRAEYDAYIGKLTNRKDWDDSDTTPGLGTVGAREGALHDGGLAQSGTWREVPLFTNGTLQREHADLFPQTIGILQQHCRDATGLALCCGGDIIFSVLTPGTKLRPHCGPSNSRLTCHLGIKVPRTLEKGCRLRVAGDPACGWEEGKCMVFDDSFEHEVVYEEAGPHESYPGDRVVLLLNFWHPDFEFKNDPQWRERSDQMMAGMDVETLPQTTIMKAPES